MPQGRKPDTKPNKVMVPNMSKVERHDDGSMSLVIPFNDGDGNRTEQTVVLAVEDGRIVMREHVTA